MFHRTADTAPAETETLYEQDALPATLDFDNTEIHFPGWEGSANNEFFADQDGDIIHDAIYTRNRTVEERLNIRLSYELEPGAYGNRQDWVNKVSNSVLAGDGGRVTGHCITL